MNSTARHAADISREAIEEQLAKLMASGPFQGSERSRKLLSYLVEQTVNGQAANLKEYTLGTKVLGKCSSFDPRTDTIVRAEASRLRSRLEKYYETGGQADLLIITLPKGSYVPQFQARSASSKSATDASKPWRSARERLTWLGLGIGAAICLLAFAFSGFWRVPRSDAAVSIAVLPFVNMSGDPGQEFFSDGMTEEITAALARIPDLRVVARESAFQYKGEKKDVRAVGQALGAAHVLEGSVRKVGSRARITAQLVRADDGVNVWTNSYDRELTDIFAIQEEIATTVARALSVPLGLKPGLHLVSNRTPDQETYELYLRGRLALRMRSRAELELLEQVVARDPNFAPGWAKLSEARREMALDFERRGDVSRRPLLVEGAEAAAKKAITLDPDYAGGYAALAGAYFWSGKCAKAIELAKQGLALDPEEPELLSNYSHTLRALGFLKESLRVREQLALVEPFNALYNRQTAEVLLANGKIDAGLKALEALHGAAIATAPLSGAYAWQGRFAEAADLLLQTPVYPNARPMFEAAARLLRSAPNKIEPPAEVPVFDSELNFVYAYVGAPERMLDWPDKARRSGDYRPILNLWWPMPSSVRKTERFKMFARDAGMADYWYAHGWPDLCHPVDRDDFVCN